jgi:t-SNARE complex subunit (syntaxin)
MEEYNRNEKEKAGRALAELMAQHENIQDDPNQRGIEHLMEQRQLEALIDRREMEVAKQKDLVEVLNQELDDKDDELAEMDEALAMARERYDQHTFYWRSVLQEVRSGKRW